MARSFTNVKLLSALVSNALTRRGYAATTQGIASRGGAASVSSKITKKAGEESAEKVSWVPDPKTGYYRPENTREIDVAELRATLLNKKLNN
ncbi:hypothetical protein L6164_034705 [Bauhinia variegata]|uniref:Uncharacterized protein n=1 Tax=Bauhinia variegata TaxID=167791 RepID=A0ACB9KVR1_BAUVA|nr:hypothetical protein L6164_034705 [Bauhinia variegata]